MGIATLTTIPPELGMGGAFLAKGGGAGSPDLYSLLLEYKAALEVLDPAVIKHRPGVPMQNRLRALGAPAKLVQGDYFTIGADLYEFRDDTPPTGGTAGRVWVYNGADSAASRANAIKAVNGEVDPALIAGAVATELLLAAAGVTTGDILILSADGIGGTPTPSATAIACTENLTTATDIWDAATMLGGVAQGPTQCQIASVTLAAAHIAKGDYQFTFDFTPTDYILQNRARNQNEAHEIVGNAISLTLAGGATPNNQDTDVIDVIAFG